NVRAWREQPPLPSTGDHGVGPPLREQFEAIRTMLLSLDQMVANQPGQALTDVGSVLRLVGRSVPRHEADWQLLYALVDELNRPAVRYAALAAVCRHVRETAEQSPRSADDYRFHLHLARDLTDGGLRARACLEAAAVHGALPGLAALADDELADAIAQESDPIFWATLLDEGGPWLFCLSESHSAKPALLADYLAQRWLQAAPEGAPEWLGGMLRLEGVLRDLVAGPVAPASWAWRGVPATEQALLQIAVWLLADDLARRGTERVVARYRQHTQRHLRLWARRL
ncbi:MAG: hypothetical protein HUU35_12305, partial [Armatimonadetes bacterium]|nr:hypothetical protein [Armatimonadota bacterium]